MFGAKVVLWFAIGISLAVGSSWYASHGVEARNAVAFRQLEDDDGVVEAVRDGHFVRNVTYGGAVFGWAVLGVLFFWGDAKRLLTLSPVVPFVPKRTYLIFLPFMLAGLTGCMRPYEPINLQSIDTSEEGFLIPLRGDKTKQSSTNSEEDLKLHLVTSKQVQIPQQWVQKGYEFLGANGVWQDAARLIKVDRQPVTREWTADPTTGTSNTNQAVWVMTSDQVEFSTGWTITARIASRDDAIRFLHNYPNGSLKDILDGEVRSKLQAVFGLEVTDLPMDELRKAATPHILKTTTAVNDFFKERGITITNIGITGGFVYKDPSIMKKMVDIFNAEQERTMAAAGTAAQAEKNKRIRMEAEGKAAALLLEKNAEASGIKAVADAKAYEIAKAQEKPDLYIALKRMELETKRQERWNGALPTTFIGGGGTNAPEMLLNIPALKP
jgi:hypothetical protein